MKGACLKISNSLFVTHLDQNLPHADLLAINEYHPFLHNGTSLWQVDTFKSNAVYTSWEVFLALQASEQYLMDSQFFAQDFLQVISFLQATQILLGRKLLFPLKDVFVMIF